MRPELPPRSTHTRVHADVALSVFSPFPWARGGICQREIGEIGVTDAITAPNLSLRQPLLLPANRSGGKRVQEGCARIQNHWLDSSDLA